MKKIDSTKRYEVLRERLGNNDIDRRSFFGKVGSRVNLIFEFSSSILGGA